MKGRTIRRGTALFVMVLGLGLAQESHALGKGRRLLGLFPTPPKGVTPPKGTPPPKGGTPQPAPPAGAPAPRTRTTAYALKDCEINQVEGGAFGRLDSRGAIVNTTPIDQNPDGTYSYRMVNGKLAGGFVGVRCVIRRELVSSKSITLSLKGYDADPTVGGAAMYLCAATADSAPEEDPIEKPPFVTREIVRTALGYTGDVGGSLTLKADADATFFRESSEVAVGCTLAGSYGQRLTSFDELVVTESE